MQPIVTELIALATLAVLNRLSSTANDNKEIEIVHNSNFCEVGNFNCYQDLYYFIFVSAKLNIVNRCEGYM